MPNQHKNVSAHLAGNDYIYWQFWEAYILKQTEFNVSMSQMVAAAIRTAVKDKILRGHIVKLVHNASDPDLKVKVRNAQWDDPAVVKFAAEHLYKIGVLKEKIQFPE